MSEVDDTEALIREVLAENPPEERGVREEWSRQVGWHRKENIYGGLRGKNTVGESAQKDVVTQGSQESELEVSDQGPTPSSIVATTKVYHTPIIIFFFGVIIVFWRVISMSKWKKKRLA